MKNNYVFKSKKIYEEFVRLYLFAETSNSNCSCTTINTCPITNNNCSCKK